MLIGEQLLHMFRDQRYMWIAGRFGSFKTGFAIRLGMEFVERGWSDHILCNFPCAVATDLHRLPRLDRCFVILDEAGNWMDNVQLRSSIAFLRKLDLYIVFPSVIEPPFKARTLNMQMTFSWLNWGIPLLRYSVELDNVRVKEKYHIHWWNPKEVFGLWDTSKVVNSDRGIIRLIDTVYRIMGDEEDDIEFPEWISPHFLKKPDSISAEPVQRAGVHVLEEQRWIAEANLEAAKKIETSLSLYRRERRKKSGRR